MKFLLTNIGKGTWGNATTPLTEENLEEIGGSGGLSARVGKIISDPTYSLKADDIDKWLVFTVDCTVTVSAGLAADSLFEGEAYNSTVTFEAGTNVTIRRLASIGLVLSPNGVFGIRMKATDDCVLYGTDPL